MKKIREFHILRHPDVDKKHPLGEAAPLTDKGKEQVDGLCKKFKEVGIDLVVVSAEDIPRFNDTAAMMQRAGFTVRRADNICFKDMKGKAPILEIVRQYREGGVALVHKLTEDPTAPIKIAIIGSWPLVSGLRLRDYETAQMDESWFNDKPGFCTGVIINVYDEPVSSVDLSNIGISMPYYDPLTEDDGDDRL